MASSPELDFPCHLTIYVPFPDNRGATAAKRTLSVDEELSKLVTRSFSIVNTLPESHDLSQSHGTPAESNTVTAQTRGASIEAVEPTSESKQRVDATQVDSGSILKTEYRATTNRMLRVAVNGFFESLGVIIECMQELDIDVLHLEGVDGLEGAQGVEQGMTGTTLTGA